MCRSFRIRELVLVFGNSRKQLIVFRLVWVVLLFPVKLVQHLAFVVLYHSLVADNAALGAYYLLIHAAGAVFPVAALAVHHYAVGITVFYIVMVKDLAGIFAGTYRAAAHTYCAGRRCAFEPVAYVNVVNVLLYDMIAAQPVKVIPVAHLVFHF